MWWKRSEVFLRALPQGHRVLHWGPCSVVVNCPMGWVTWCVEWVNCPVEWGPTGCILRMRGCRCLLPRCWFLPQMRKLGRRTYSVACAVGHHMRAHRTIARTLVTTVLHGVIAVPLHPPTRNRNQCCALCSIVSANKYKWPPRGLLVC